MKTNIGIVDKDRAAVAEILNRVLADEFVLYNETRNYHWNVVGSDFAEMHKFFEAQYEELDSIIDDVAERVRSIGEETVATLKNYLEATRLKEPPAKRLPKDTMLKNLLVNHETVIRALRESADACAEKHHDMGTNDFLVGLMEQHEKMAWMIRSFLD